MFAASCLQLVLVGIVGYVVIGINSVVIVVCTWRYVFGLFCVRCFAGFDYWFG